MTWPLPEVEIVREYIDESFDKHTPVMVLQWEKMPGNDERLWELPEGMCVVGGPPRRLGVRIHPRAEDAFSVRLLWENTQMSWPALSRVELLASSLAPVLSALDIDLWSLLDQAVPTASSWRRAA